MSQSPRLAWWARCYVGVFTLHYVLSAWWALTVDAGQFVPPQLREPVSMRVWGLAMAALAAAGLVVLVIGRENLYRVLAIISFFLSTLFIGRVVIAYGAGDLRTPLAPIWGGALMLKDLLMAAQSHVAKPELPTTP